MGKSGVKGKNEWVLLYWTGLTVSTLSGLFTILSFFMAAWLYKLFQAVGNYDKGSVLLCLGCMGSSGIFAGTLASYIAAKSAKRNLAYVLRFSIYSYLGWGVGLCIVYFASAIAVFVMRDFRKLWTVRILTEQNYLHMLYFDEV